MKFVFLDMQYGRMVDDQVQIRPILQPKGLNDVQQHVRARHPVKCEMKVVILNKIGTVLGRVARAFQNRFQCVDTSRINICHRLIQNKALKR